MLDLIVYELKEIIDNAQFYLLSDYLKSELYMLILLLFYIIFFFSFGNSIINAYIVRIIQKKIEVKNFLTILYLRFFEEI